MQRDPVGAGGGFGELGVEEVGAVDYEEVKAVEVGQFFAGVAGDFFEEDADHFVFLHVHYYAGLEAAHGVEGGKGADVAVLNGKTAYAGTQQVGGLESHAEASGGYHMDDVDDGRVSEVHPHGLGCGLVGTLLVVRHQPHEQADVLLVPFQDFFLLTATLWRCAEDAGLDGQVSDFRLRGTGHHHGHRAIAIATLGTDAPEKGNFTCGRYH